MKIEIYHKKMKKYITLEYTMKLKRKIMMESKITQYLNLCMYVMSI